MLWNRYESDRPYLNMYQNEHFEAGTGMTDPDSIEKEILHIDDVLCGVSHTIVKAKAFAFVLDHCAIEVNPRDRKSVV